jgi:hypothetical protein
MAAIEGTWRRVQTCDEVLAAIDAAGLAETHSGWLAGFFEDEVVPSSGDVCKTAVGPLPHSHFFTADGQFGSHNERGEKVDFGDFQVVDATIVAFPSHAAEFGYDGELAVGVAITDGVATFDVRLPDVCEGPCRDAYAWALSAFASGPWQADPG